MRVDGIGYVEACVNTGLGETPWKRTSRRLAYHATPKCRCLLALVLPPEQAMYGIREPVEYTKRISVHLHAARYATNTMQRHATG